MKTAEEWARSWWGQVIDGRANSFEELTMTIKAAQAEARAQGRCEGLEEAAALVKKRKGQTQARGIFVNRHQTSEAIRALIAQPEPDTKGEKE